MKNNKFILSPSILSADFGFLANEVKEVSKYNIDFIHIDVMDGSFVDNITIGHDVVKAIRPHSHKIFDVHLMIDNPQKHIENFVKAGADIITIHAETVVHLDYMINYIKSFGIKAGISIVPSTSENVLDYILDNIDLILVMSVNPGYGGQKFLDSQLQKIYNIKQKINMSNNKPILQVDGGINQQTIEKVANAGANAFVMGSAIFNDNNRNYKQNIENYRNILESLC